MFHYKAVRQSSNAEKSGCGNSRAFFGEENTQHNHIRLNTVLSAHTPHTPSRQHVKNIESNLYNIIQHISFRPIAYQLVPLSPNAR